VYVGSPDIWNNGNYAGTVVIYDHSAEAGGHFVDRAGPPSAWIGLPGEIILADLLSAARWSARRATPYHPTP
jgi:hypothetical protein